MSYILEYYDFYNAASQCHIKEQGTHEIGIPAGCDDYLVICNVRNPYSHVLSVWHWRNFDIDENNNIIIRQTFPEWVSGMTGMGEFSPILTYKKQPDIYVRIENYMEDLAKIPFVDLKDPNVQSIIQNQLVQNSYTESGGSGPEFILRRNKNNPTLSDWQSYYTQKEIDIVAHFYHDAFMKFGYDPKSI
jgi:hypothetical protein